ncbi:MAG: ThuA domain-containing protein [Spirochaetes bacterium]|nr:ThuA domain-containing protein [Spirochaetota bacterium]
MGGRAILVVSSGLVHPSHAARLAFAAVVRGASAVPPEFRASTRAFRLLDPARHAAAAVFFHSKSIEARDVAALEEFVDAGGGLFALHGALASFKDEPHWAALLGAAFAGHDRPALLAAGPSADPGPFEGIPAFAVTDELYQIRAVGPIVARFAAIIARGGAAAVPILWTRAHGRGRVCCCTLGHAAPTLRHATVQRILERALAWVSGTGEVPRGA